MALTYTWAQDNADDIVQFYFLKLKAKYLPLLMLALDLLLSGQGSMLTSGTGYVAGHLYLFLDVLYPSVSGHAKLISTPGFIKWLFPAPRGGVPRTTFGTVYQSAAREDAPASASASGFGRFSFSGPFQGKGRRLGD